MPQLCHFKSDFDKSLTKGCKKQRLRSCIFWGEVIKSDVVSCVIHQCVMSADAPEVPVVVLCTADKGH